MQELSNLGAALTPIDIPTETVPSLSSSSVGELGPRILALNDLPLNFQPTFLSVQLSSGIYQHHPVLTGTHWHTLALPSSYLHSPALPSCYLHSPALPSCYRHSPAPPATTGTGTHQNSPALTSTC
ncbi:hypothetical protein Pelo_7473 [Pelomyxa schiedti]|nr:hypothetical protein Pelo_7473 [Pelomyxa schiedti]